MGSMIMVYATMMLCWKDECKTSVNLRLSGVERKYRLHTVFDFAVISVTSLLTLTYYL